MKNKIDEVIDNIKEMKNSIPSKTSELENDSNFLLPSELSNYIPTIGENDNWFIGQTDTEVPARGKDGKEITMISKGKSLEDLKIPVLNFLFSDGTRKTVELPSIFEKDIDIADNGDGVDIYYKDLDSMATFTVSNGKNGRGISSIKKTSTEGLVDIYTITYSDNTTSTYTVKNGKDINTDISLNISGGAANNYPRIKTVDENGRPTSYESVDINEDINNYIDRHVYYKSEFPAILFSKDNREGHKAGEIVSIAAVDETGNPTDFNAQEINIPTKVSDLENDAGYLTEHQNLDAYAKKTDLPTVPTKVSQLQNDSGFLTAHQDLSEYAKTADIPIKVSELANDAGYLTAHQSLDGYAKKTDIPSVPTKTSQLQNDSGFLTEHQSLTEYVKKTDLPTVPTKVSQLQNDSGYLTQHQSLTEYAKKSELPTSLKNPNSLTIQVGGTSTVYDGSEAKTINIATEDTAPSYWTTHLSTKADQIHELMESAGRNKTSFLFYTDAHWDYGAKKAPLLLKYLYNHTPINKTFFGGDIVNSESTDREVMTYLWDWRNQVREIPNHHSVVGNHDDGNATNNLFPTNYIYSFLLAAEEDSNVVQGGDMYYYIDDPCEKTRFLFLDTAYIGLNTDQLTFIKESLKSTPENWHIVPISHIWYEPDYDQYNVRPIPIAGYGTGVQNLVNIFDNYNSRADEFSECKAKIEFCIGGHCHRDYTGRTTGGIPIILCETDSYHGRSGLANTAGTTNESAVNAIIVNYTTKNINIVRIGRGENFVVPLVEQTTPATYTNLIPTSVDTTGAVYNGTGYKAGTHISDSDGVTETSASAYWCTGLIPVNKGDVVRIKYVFDKSTFSTSDLYYYSKLTFYNSDKSFNRFKYLKDFLTGGFISGTYEWNGTNFEGTLTFTFDGSSSMFNNAKYFRISSAYLKNAKNVQTSINNAVITINEEIN